MRWNAKHLEQLAYAQARCAGGEPTTVLVTGDAGMGKSTVLDEFVRRAQQFVAVRVEAVPATTPTPYGVLGRLGIDLDSGEPSSTLAAQQVRRWLDDRLTLGPVLITIDDVQWADDESVETLISVMERTTTEPILLAMASRPLHQGQHSHLRRWAARHGQVVRIDLSGLDLDAAVDLIHTVRPGLPRRVAESLWTHVDGNPLYLRALADEHEADELTNVQVLPAPARFASTVVARLARLSSGARSLAAAAAVLGDTWSALREVAAVAEVGDPARAADELASSQLVTVRSTSDGTQMRLKHALTRSAVYQSLSIQVRRDLHARAARVVDGVTVVFEHRLAATPGYDDTLAADLEAHAERLRSRRSFASAARHQRLASTVTTDPLVRERRRLDSMFDHLLAMDLDAVRADPLFAGEVTDERRRDLVLAVMAVWERRPHEGARTLTSWSGGDGDVVQFRVETMLAWALLMSGAPEADIRTVLDRADATGVFDAAVARFGLLVRAQIVARHVTDTGQVDQLRALPDDPRLVPVKETSALAWRGTFMANAGLFTPAISDLTEVTDRMQHGHVEFSSGTYHALLGRTQWLVGDWARARVNLRSAAELSARYPHPIVVSATALPAIGDGSFAVADEQLDLARELIDRVPWPEAKDQLIVTEVIRAHAGGQHPSDKFTAFEPALDDLNAGRTTKSILWLTHAALAALWAGRLDTVSALADRIERPIGGAPWGLGVAEWLRGLTAEIDGDGKAALAHLEAAAHADLSDLPLYRAHTFADLARVTHLVRGEPAARRSLASAADQYLALGAHGYVERMTGLRSGRLQPGHGRTNAQLSEREHDVLTLLVSGLSYEQIARDLFITRSTVSYHLGNIYAKANVKTRHQLTHLVRSDPQALGLPAAVYPTPKVRRASTDASHIHAR